jgi:hypothetical protein
MTGRDAFFQELFGRAPTAEEILRFERMGTLARLTPDDSLWYAILVNEFYEDRLNTRLAEIDRVAENAAEKALIKISEVVYSKANELAAQRSKGFFWRSYGFAVGMVVLLCAVVLNVGYTMGSGKDPFWVHPDNSWERTLSWFFNVPSGWLVAIGSGPFLVGVLRDSLETLRLGIGGDVVFPMLKFVGAVAGLIFLLFAVFGI